MFGKKKNAPKPPKNQAEVKLQRYCQNCGDYTEHKSWLRGTWEKITCGKCGTGTDYRTG